MARASTVTLLALDRFARILGIPPPHFNQAASPENGTGPFPAQGCNDIFYQYNWQDSDSVSREEMARAIKDAEDTITSVLGFTPAPDWVSQDWHLYPRHYRPEILSGVNLNVRTLGKSIKSSRGKFILAGQRATSTITDGVTVVYSDPDGDGYDELATITTTTILTERCELKVYFAGEGGNREWEVRPAKTIVLSGGSVTFTFDAWQLLDPDLWEAFPTSGQANALTINLLTVANYVTTVDIHREFTDFAEPSAQFYWERRPTLLPNIINLCDVCGGSGCEACTLITQTGCSQVRDVINGVVVPFPATFNTTTNQWDKVLFTECREPDQVKIWYYAGDQSEAWLSDQSCDPLSDYYAYAITWIAVARLDRELCTCATIQSYSRDLQVDMAFVGDNSFLLGDALLDNPFGTKKGEIMAWQRIGRATPSNIGVAAV